MRSFLLILSVSFTLAMSSAVMLSGCTKKSTNEPASTAKQEMPLSGASASTGKILHVYTWSNYFNPDSIKGFETKTGAKVDFSYFSSNEELMAKLQAGAKGYDVIVPSGYVVQALKSLNLLLPLNSADWPELKELKGRFKSPPFDPNHEVVAPFAWGTTGLAVNKNKIKGKVDGWSWIFEHAELAGQLTMLDDPPDVVGTALRYLGYSINDKSSEAMAKAKALLKKQKPWLKAYTSEVQPLLSAGETAISQAYSTDVGQLLAKNPNLEFVTPKEGGVVWVDNLGIAASSQSPDLAREFIRHMLRSEVQAYQAQFIFAYPVVSIQVDKSPAEKDLVKYEFTSDDPEMHDKIQRLWTELKAE